MDKNLNNFWTRIKDRLTMTMAPLPEQKSVAESEQYDLDGNLPDVLPEMELKDMVKYRFSGDYFFHGSPIKLDAGKDKLEAKEDYFRLRLFLGTLPVALRFALVRKWGLNQMEATDFFVFADRKYKLVIYDGFSVGPDWYKKHSNHESYLYMVRRSDVANSIASEKNGGVQVTCDAPIVARAVVNQRTLADAGFMFASEILHSTRRWWGVPNIDASIKDKVLADYDLWVIERQR